MHTTQCAHVLCKALTDRAAAPNSISSLHLVVKFFNYSRGFQPFQPAPSAVYGQCTFSVRFCRLARSLHSSACALLLSSKESAFVSLCSIRQLVRFCCVARSLHSSACALLLCSKESAFVSLCSSPLSEVGWPRCPTL